MRLLRRPPAWLVLLGLALAGCAAGPDARPAAPVPPAAAPPASVPAAPAPPAAQTGRPVVAHVVGRPSAIAGFRPSSDSLRAFRRACPRLLRRADPSGLTRAEDWAAACADRGEDPARFFDTHFRAVRLDDGRAFVTGYYEPELAACRAPGGACSTPIHGVPDDLVSIDLGQFADDLDGRTIRGRWDGVRFRPHFSRAEIADGALDGRRPALAFAWTSDPVGLFFLHIQGSGLLRYGDGTVQRIGYAGQNGHPYVAIGRLLRQRGAIEGTIGMAEIRQWLATNPEAGQALMRENPSYVFLRPLPAALDGPLGSLNVPLIPRANAAIDARVAPLGAPIWLETRLDGAEYAGLLVAADTGGAIRGANRIDLFFGPGAEAARIAGALQAEGRALLLLPVSAAERLPGS